MYLIKHCLFLHMRDKNTARAIVPLAKHDWLKVK